MYIHTHKPIELIARLCFEKNGIKSLYKPPYRTITKILGGWGERGHYHYGLFHIVASPPFSCGMQSPCPFYMLNPP